jgi:hypothetical protein
VLYVTYRKASLQNVNLNTTFAVTVMIFEADICVFQNSATFVSFGFRRLFIYGLLNNIANSANCRAPNVKSYLTIKY